MARPGDDGGGHTFVAAIVGIDGCGKSSAFRGALELLAERVEVAGIGDDVFAGAPGSRVRERRDLRLARVTALVGRAAKRSRHPWLYKQLKTLDLVGRSRLRDLVVAHEAPAVLLTDGDPLVNTVAWSLGRLYRSQLEGSDERVVDVMRYLAGERAIPFGEITRYLRRAPQLVALNRSGVARFAFPDLVIHLEIDGATAMGRIRERGRALQAHESAEALDELEAGYQRACRLLETRCGVEVIRIPCARTGRDEVVAAVAAAVLARLPEPVETPVPRRAVDAIDIVATTMSGSLRDQRKVGRIGPSFRALTRRAVLVHEADTHAQARDLARAAVAAGGRTIVSAGGAGTFNAVLEGCLVDGDVPAGLRLAFLRKGSADLIGKMLRIPDDLGAAVGAIVDGIEQDRCVGADVLSVEATGHEGHTERRHVIGFSGLGVFGDVPRFTESRLIKLYKGVLSTLFGDYGPFYVGLGLATVWWYVQRRRGRVLPLTLHFDAETVAPATWTSVVIVNGDLGRAFPLGRGLPFATGTLRVVALRYAGLRGGLRQLRAARSGRLLDDPGRYGCLVRDVRTFVARPTMGSPTPYMVNIDGLRLMAQGPVRFDVDGRVQLIAGPDASG